MPSMCEKSESGFSLIEVMITVAIIGILASVAIPFFQRYKLNSRTAEAKVNLKAIAASEMAYQAEFDSYLVCDPNPGAGVPGVFKDSWDKGTSYEVIGFSPKDSLVHYQYAVEVGTTGNIVTSFTATATGNLDGDGDNAVYQTSESTPVGQTSATIGHY